MPPRTVRVAEPETNEQDRLAAAEAARLQEAAFSSLVWPVECASLCVRRCAC